MQVDPDARRRWLGPLCLASGLLMLVCGQTMLENRLRQSPFLTLAYWLVCFVFTALAMLAAVLDLRYVRSRTRQEQRQLLEDILKKIETEARAKKGRSEERRVGKEGRSRG